jgi:hypothetical protein
LSKTELKYGERAVSENIYLKEIKMNYRSNVAALALVTVVGLGLTGCGGGGGSAPVANVEAAPVAAEAAGSASDTNCPIPDAVQQPIDLNKTTAGQTLMLSEEAFDMARMMVWDGWDMGGYSMDSLKTTSSLDDAIQDRVVGLYVGTSGVKSLRGEYPIEMGDDIACSLGGTYSAHAEITEGTTYNPETGETEERTDSFSITFNTCKISEDDDNDDGLREMLEYLWYRTGNMLESVADPEPVVRTFLLNGSVTLSYEGTFTDFDSEDSQEYMEQETDAWSSHVVADNFTVEVFEGNETVETYKTDIDFLVSNDRNYSDVSTQTEATEDGNYTTTEEERGTGTIHLTLSAQEDAFYVESNVSESFSALCYRFDGTNNTQKRNVSKYVDNTQETLDGTKYQRSEFTLNGYVAYERVRDGNVDDFYDLFGDNLNVVTVQEKSRTGSRDEEGNWSEETTRSKSFALDGKAGSMILGGSVVFNTESAWLMSSEYDTHVTLTPDSLGNIYQFPYTPYAGKTLIEGVDTAVVEFGLTDANETYIDLTVDEETQRYESVDDLFEDGDLEYAGAR